MAGEIKKVQFSEGLNVDTPADIPFTADDFTGIMPTAKGGTGVNGSAVFPTSGTVATTADITAAFEGKKFKDPVVVATASNITLSGEQTIDGVLTSSSRVLVKSQSAPAENGIYVSAAGAWSRASDANTWDELTSAIVSVERGTSYSDTGWFCIANSGGTLGTTAIVWEQKFGTGAIDLTSDVTGLLPIGNGGTNASNAADAYDNLSPASAKGDIVSHNGTGAEVLAVGANGKVLGANSAQASGLEWVDAATLPIDLTTDVTGTLPIGNGGTGATTANSALANISGMTAKGDIITRDASSPAILGVGVNGQVLTADPSQPLGMKWADIGGGGSGEINVIENPSAASAITGWVASAAGITVARTTTASDLPLEGPVDSAIKITPVSGTDYVRYRWTMPAALKNKKLKLEWYQRPLSGYASGDLKVEVYKNSLSDYTGSYTEFALSTDSSGTSAIPNATGKYTTTYDTDDGDYYELRVVRVSGTTALNITNVIIGPGIQPQGAVVSGEQSYSPTLVGFGSPTIQSFTYSRTGEYIEIQGRFVTGTNTGTEARIPLPTGLIISGYVANKVVGRLYQDAVNSSDDSFSILAIDGNSYLTIGEQSSNDGLTNVVGTVLASSQPTSFYARVRIAEWAGSGTVNLAQNDVEFASNSSTSTTTSDSTSFAHGPSGSQIQNITADITRRVRFNNIQANDTFIFEISADRSQWFPVLNGGVTFAGVANVEPYTLQGSNSYGIGRMQRVTGSTTDIDIRFGQYISFGATYGAAGSSYGATLGAYYWRVRKISGGQAVGFGAATSSTMGLLPPVTSMSDGLATMLGHKQYLHGTSYNGGNAPTISGSGATIVRGVFIPYQMQDGTWRMKFNYYLTVSTSTRTTYSTSINGVTFKAVTDFNQAVTVNSPAGTAQNAYQGFALQNTNSIEAYHASFSTGSYGFSGDVELNGKPTWAY